MKQHWGFFLRRILIFGFVIKSTKAVSKQHAWITNSEPLQSIESANIAAIAHIEMDVTLHVMCPKLSCVANWESCDGS